MSKSAEKDYNIKTNVRALAKVNNFLKQVSIDNIPHLDFSKKRDTENFIILFELQLSENPKLFNEFFQTVTGTEDNFLTKELEICHKIATDFFVKLPMPFKNMIQTSVNELKKQKDMVTKKNLKSLEKAMEKVIKQEIMKQKKNSEKPETSI